MNELSTQALMQILIDNYGYEPQDLRDMTRENLLSMLSDEDVENQESSDSFDDMVDVEEVNDVEEEEVAEVPEIHSSEWSDYVLSQMSDDEKQDGNPTVDGLRKVLQRLIGPIISSISVVNASPSQGNNFATVTHNITVLWNNSPMDVRTFSGAADASDKNCNMPFSNYPVAMAETRAEGRALRRALQLRTVCAEELQDVKIVKEEENPSKINTSQVGVIRMLAERLKIDLDLLTKTKYNSNNLDMSYDNALELIALLNVYQQDSSKIPDEVKIGVR